jgi:hypothetical protein
LQFLITLFTSFVKFIPRHFILFNAIVKVIIFLILYSENSLTVHKNTIAFYVLTLNLATLLNLFINSNIFNWLPRIFYTQNHIICKLIYSQLPPMFLV